MKMSMLLAPPSDARFTGANLDPTDVARDWRAARDPPERRASMTRCFSVLDPTTKIRSARPRPAAEALAPLGRAGDGGGVDEGDFDRIVVARARDDVDARAMAMDAMTTPRGGAECGAARAATRRRLERDARWRQLSVM